jgi:hypothetical protein
MIMANLYAYFLKQSNYYPYSYYSVKVAHDIKTQHCYALQPSCFGYKVN